MYPSTQHGEIVSLINFGSTGRMEFIRSAREKIAIQKYIGERVGSGKGSWVSRSSLFVKKPRTTNRPVLGRMRVAGVCVGG